MMKLRTFFCAILLVCGPGTLPAGGEAPSAPKDPDAAAAPTENRLPAAYEVLATLAMAAETGLVREIDHAVIVDAFRMVTASEPAIDAEGGGCIFCHNDDRLREKRRGHSGTPCDDPCAACYPEKSRASAARPGFP